MNRNESRELREQRASVAHQMSELVGDGKTPLTPENRAKFEGMDREQAALLVRITDVERVATLTEETRASGAPPAAAIEARQGPEDPTSPEAKANKKQADERYHNAWLRLMRYGYSAKPGQFDSMTGLPMRYGISDEDKSILSTRGRLVSKDVISAAQASLPAELRDMLTQGGGAYPGGVGSEGGFFVPTGFVYDVEEALKYYGPMLNGGANDPTIFETATGQPLPYPTSNDTIVTGERLSENQAATTNDVSLGSILFAAWIYSTKMVKVSQALLQDSAFDLQAFLTKQFAIRIGRILNTDMTLGSGVNQPNGIMTAAVSGGTAVGANDNDGVSGLNTIGSDDFTTLEHSVDPLYRRGAKYMMHDSVLAAIKKVKDKYGRPLWMPDVRGGQPDTVNGYQFLINNDMATLQTAASSPTVSNNTLLFGQLNKYMIRRVKELSIMRLDERFAEYGQVAFLGFARYDGQLLDAGTRPVKYLTNTY